MRYEDLTQEEKDFLTDDCGNHLLDVPDFMWTESCRRHDFAYWYGHTKKDRKKADLRWYHDMLEAVDEADLELLNHGKWVYKMAATIYYVVVRLFSDKFFEYGDRYKTQEDLDKEMRDAGKI